MALDFTEIPQANVGSGLQDTFELFARDFLEMIGYEILQHPDRGADGKKDIIVQETRTGLSGITKIKWLVSCKHYTHSGKSVSDMDEPNITDRVSVHKCDGFLGVYSTLPATSLGTNLNSLKDKMHIQSFDNRQIEKILLESPKGLALASRYFPISYANYTIENPKPADIFEEQLGISCEYCDKNLLEDRSGIMVLLRRFSNIGEGEYKRQPYEEAYFSCKGKCNHILKNIYNQRGPYVDQWGDLTDYLSPIGYIKKTMAWFNSLQQKEEILPEAFEKVKKLFLNTFPYISREQTTGEKEKIKIFLQEGLSDFL